MRESQSDVDAALAYFQECILRPHQAKERYYREFGVWGESTASNTDWIVFAALLTGDRPGSRSSLAELSHHHVRSHRLGYGPIYTIVQEAVEEEFEEFKERFHLVFAYADNLSRVELRRFTGTQWVDFVEEFGGISFFAFSGYTDPEIFIPPKWLSENSRLLLVLDAGKITHLSPELVSRTVET